MQWYSYSIILLCFLFGGGTTTNNNITNCMHAIHTHLLLLGCLRDTAMILCVKGQLYWQKGRQLPISTPVSQPQRQRILLSAINNLFLCVKLFFCLASIYIIFEPLKHTFHTRYARVSDIYNFCSQQTCQALVVPVKIEKEIALRGYQHMLLGKEKEIVNLPKKQHLLTKSLKIRS